MKKRIIKSALFLVLVGLGAITVWALPGTIYDNSNYSISSGATKTLINKKNVSNFFNGVRVTTAPDKIDDTNKAYTFFDLYETNSISAANVLVSKTKVSLALCANQNLGQPIFYTLTIDNTTKDGSTTYSGWSGDLTIKTM